MFPDEDPIGKRIQAGRDVRWHTVIGVAENVKNGGLVEPDNPEIYFLRSSIASNWSGRVPLMIVDSVLCLRQQFRGRSQIAQLDPTVPVGIETLNEQVSKMADRTRFETALLGFFAFTGLLMAVIGLYCIIAFMGVSGPRKSACAWPSAPAVATSCNSSFRISPHDPASYIAVTLLLALVAVAATLIPARSAMKTDPMGALGWE